MKTLLIISLIFVYLLIGALFAAIVDDNIEVPTILFWPVYLMGMMLLALFGLAIKLGLKLRKYYLKKPEERNDERK